MRALPVEDVFLYQKLTSYSVTPSPVMFTACIKSRVAVAEQVTW